MPATIVLKAKETLKLNAFISWNKTSEGAMHAIMNRICDDKFVMRPLLYKSGLVTMTYN